MELRVAFYTVSARGPLALASTGRPASRHTVQPPVRARAFFHSELNPRGPNHAINKRLRMSTLDLINIKPFSKFEEDFSTDPIA